MGHDAESAAMPANYSPNLYNKDMAPTPPEEKTWNMWEIAALWVGMSVCIPTYMLAGSLIQQGLSWLEAVGVIMAGNLVVLVPMILNAHAGTKYGIPFPVLLRTSYGHKGAHLPAVLRALVACGWFGIQTWIGGVALHTMTHSLAAQMGNAAMWPDQFGYKFFMYIVFWVMNLYFVWNGTESIRWLESYAAPLLLGIGVILLGWGVSNGGGLTAVLDRSYDLSKPVIVATSDGKTIANDTRSVTLKLAVLNDLEGKPKAKSMILGDVVKKSDGTTENKPLTAWIPYQAEYTLTTGQGAVWAQFDSELHDTDKRMSSVVTAPIDKPAGQEKSKAVVYLMAITAMVAFWATLALNIPDITRYAKSQRDQALGQAIGLPLTMGLYSFIGLAVTCATLNIFPDLVIGADAIWDPVALLGRFDSKTAVVVAMFMLAIATLTTNIAANVISPANCFSNAFPSKITFRSGGMIAACLGVLMMPWKLMGAYISFLLTYSGLLGPIMGVMVVDYVVVRKMEIDVDALYVEGSEYSYGSGFHLAGVVATAIGVAVVGAGFVVPSLSFLRDGAWFSGAISAGIIYALMAKRPKA